MFEICVFKHAEIFITYIKHMFNTLVELTDSSYKKDARIFLPLRLSCICGWSCGGSCGTVAAVNRAKNALGFLKLLLLVRLIGPPTNRVIYCENEEEERAEFSCVALFMWSFFSSYSCLLCRCACRGLGIICSLCSRKNNKIPNKSLLVGHAAPIHLSIESPFDPYAL